MTDLRPLPVVTGKQLSKTAQQLLGPIWTKPSAAKMKNLEPMVIRLLSRWPDYGKTGPAYLLSMVEYFAGLSDSDADFLMDKNTGISAKSEFLPNEAACNKLLEERRNKWGPLPDYSHIVRGADGKPLVDNTPSSLKQPAFIQDRYGNRRVWTPEDDEREARTKDMANKAWRMQAYAKHLGEGDMDRGWQIIMDAAISEPPADFKPEDVQ